MPGNEQSFAMMNPKRLRLHASAIRTNQAAFIEEKAGLSAVYNPLAGYRGDA
jgi:hypothetical protein